MSTHHLAVPNRRRFRWARQLVRRYEEPDLLPAFALLWIVSAVRVVGAVFRREVFGAEATLALAAVVCVPWLLLRRGGGRSEYDPNSN